MRNPMCRTSHRIDEQGAVGAFIVGMVAALSTGCQHKVTGPTPEVSGVVPAAVCDTQLTTPVTVLVSFHQSHHGSSQEIILHFELVWSWLSNQEYIIQCMVGCAWKGTI